VLRLIATQGKLTDDLAASILASVTLQQVDDLYLPYRPKRKTRASVARERGLQPLADLILSQARLPGSSEEALRTAATPFINPEAGVESVEVALAGARDICAETIMEDAAVRGAARMLFLREGMVSAKLAVAPEQAAERDPRGVYRLYYDFAEPVPRMAPHRRMRPVDCPPDRRPDIRIHMLHAQQASLRQLQSDPASFVTPAAPSIAV